MSKNIVIQEGGIGKQLTADKLKTNLVGGGTCLWVPEDERQLGTKNITENGTYNASSDGLSGYSQVFVNVAGGSGGEPGGPGSSIVGKDEDGDESVVSVDEDGDIDSIKIPSSIKVITPPTNPYGIYQDGQAISTNGMVVKSYLKTGGEYGTVPNGQITLNPTTAVYDESTDPGTGEQSIVGPDGFVPGNVTVSAHAGGHFEVPGSEFDPIGMYVFDFNQSVTICHPKNTQPLFAGRASPVSFDYYGIMRKDGSETQHNTYSFASSFTYDGKTVVYGHNNLLTNVVREQSDLIVTSSDIPKLAWTLIYGDITEIRPGSRQTITASWPQPRTGKALTDTFEILVAPSYTPGGGE